MYESFNDVITQINATDQHFFITGQAGTGKSTFLKYLTKQSNKNVVVLAPTGVAAVNIGGQTIHSFFGFKPDITPDIVREKMSNRNSALYKNLEMIIIDEISMVRADLLDCIDLFLRFNGPKPNTPFGGVQMIFIGDLYQLPPVVTKEEQHIFKTQYKSPYFFSAKSIQFIKLNLIEFKEVFRQKDRLFIKVLNSIRLRKNIKLALALLNKNVRYDIKPMSGYIYLTTVNARVNQINSEYLEKIPSELYSHEGTITGDFKMQVAPTPLVLQLKTGAQVMLLNNDPEKRWYNGSIGKIVNIDPDNEVIQVSLNTGRIVNVSPYTWSIYKFRLNPETKQIESEVVGSYTQYPLKLAWAITIHKSQGKTFEKVIVDLHHGAFSHGQTYVALSRCTSLKGLILKRKITETDVIVDKRIIEFVNKLTKKT